MNVKRINSATRLRLCQNLISYWIYLTFCVTFIFRFYLWPFAVSPESLENIHTGNQSVWACKRLSSQQAPSAPVSVRYELFFFSFAVKYHIRMIFPGKTVGRSLRRNIHHLVLSVQHSFSRLLNRCNIFTDVIPTTYFVSPICGASLSLLAVTRRVSRISAMVESMIRKSGAEIFNMMAFLFSLRLLSIHNGNCMPMPSRLPKYILSA